MSSTARMEERELRRNERIDRHITTGRTILFEYPDDLPTELRAIGKAWLSGLAKHLAKERAAGNLLSRSSSPNGFLALTSEEKQLLANYVSRA